MNTMTGAKAFGGPKRAQKTKAKIARAQVLMAAARERAAERVSRRSKGDTAVDTTAPSFSPDHPMIPIHDHRRQTRAPIADQLARCLFFSLELRANTLSG